MKHKEKVEKIIEDIINTSILKSERLMLLDSYMCLVNYKDLFAQDIAEFIHIITSKILTHSNEALFSDDKAIKDNHKLKVNILKKLLEYTKEQYVLAEY